MQQLSEWEKFEAKSIRNKNKKVWANYLFLCDKNKNREKALITFTSPQATAYDKLSEIQLIKRFFAKLLTNLRIDIDRFAVVELGENKNNPHLHVQLFYNEDDLAKIKRAYTKTLQHFNLEERRCVFTLADKNKTHIKYFAYILKEYSKKLSDKELLELDNARKKLRVGNNRNMQFISHSHNTLTRDVYKHLYFKYGIGFTKADFFYNAQYMSVKKSKNQRISIIWHNKPILEVAFFLELALRTHKMRKKILYSNKRAETENFHLFFVLLKSAFGFT